MNNPSVDTNLSPSNEIHVDYIQGNIKTLGILFKSDQDIEDDFANHDKNSIPTLGGQILIEDSQQEIKTLSQRLFGKMNQGSLRGSIFSMVTTALGAGCLALPKKFSILSVGLSLISMVFISVCMLMNLYFLAKASARTKVYDYSELAEKVLSKKWKYLINIGSIIFLFGALIAYQIVIYSLIQSLYYDYIGDSSCIDKKDFIDHGFFNYTGVKWGVSMGVTVLLFPLSLIRTLSEFRYASIFGILSIVSLMLVSL